jgi:superfamily II DNA/RNA helicase
MWTYKNNLHISVFCQISDVLSEAGAPCGIKSVCLYGGTKKEPQMSALKSGVVR